MKRVLWIEDGALVEFHPMLGAVYADGRFDLVLALDAADGLNRLLNNEFDAVIVDIRLPPGNDPRFIRLHSESHDNPDAARLGLTLLQAVLVKDTSKLGPLEVPSWVCAERFAILTVEGEGELGDWYRQLEPKPLFRQKSIHEGRRVVVELIDEILARCPREEGQT